MNDPRPRDQPAQDAKFISALAQQIKKTPIPNMTEEPRDGWTFATFERHFDRVLAERDRLYSQRFNDQQIATDKAKEAVDNTKNDSRHTVALVTALLALAISLASLIALLLKH